MADRCVRGVRVGRRVGDLPRDDAVRSLSSSSRPSSRALGGRCQLPVRSHRGIDRGLRRPRPAAHVHLDERRLSGVRLDVRRDSAHVSRNAPSTGRRGWGCRGHCCRHRSRVHVPCGRCRSGGTKRRRRRVKVAVIAHSGKTLGGGLPELRRVLEAEGVEEPFWCEIPKSRKAPAQVRRALAEGVELVFAWGGDGMVQRCVDVLAGSTVSLAIIPAGTANLFATNLGIPKDIEEAVAVGLHGDRRKVDVGHFNGERFAVMAGAGFDAAMIRDAGDGGLKERLGRIAYVWTGSENLRSKPFRAEIKVDAVAWYKGKATCILVGNVGELLGGIAAFEDARPDDGKLELGVVTAEGLLEWGRMIARTALGTASSSPFARTTKARSVKVTLSRKVLYELDGGDRTKVKAFKVKVEAGAITVCVPG